MSAPVYIFTQGLWRLREEVAVLSGLAPRRAVLPWQVSGAVAGWGHKPSARLARRTAERKGLPYLACEDGFLRSVKPGSGQRPQSMILDRSGIYYDARQPSDLETLLQSGSITEADCRRAQELLGLLRSRRLSKYNDGEDRTDGLPVPRDRPLVLLVDQTAGDQAIAGGLAGGASFARMVEAARAENPGAALLVKLHPEVMSGRKAGYLRDLAARHAIPMLARNINPWALFGLGPKLYTVSSQLGFEALLAGLEVVCFGAPFYAGWGLTDDRLELPRRSRKRSPLELAAAAYLRYCHYFDAWTRRPVDALTAVDQLSFLRGHFHDNRRPVVGYRIAWWKRHAVTAMLRGAAGKPLFTRSLALAAAAARGRDGVIAAWAPAAAALRADARLRGIPILAVEDGFIRSAGLGAAFVQPMSLVFDSRGIYYDSRTPSDIEAVLSNSGFSEAELGRARQLRRRIVAAGVTKYNLAGSGELPAMPDGRERILVPGQVADDAAVVAGRGAEIDPGHNVNQTLLAAVRACHPQAFVIFKPHPDVERIGRAGALTEWQMRRDADLVVRAAPIEVLLAVSHRVETFGSLAGFEALLRGLPVTVHGQPFYGGWGLTEDIEPNPRRVRKRILDELVAAALITYPRYWDPASGLPCPPETVLDRLDELRRSPPPRGAGPAALAGKLVIAWRRLMSSAVTGRNPE